VVRFPQERFQITQESGTNGSAGGTLTRWLAAVICECAIHQLMIGGSQLHLALRLARVQSAGQLLRGSAVTSWAVSTTLRPAPEVVGMAPAVDTLALGNQPGSGQAASSGGRRGSHQPDTCNVQLFVP